MDSLRQDSDGQHHMCGHMSAREDIHCEVGVQFKVGKATSPVKRGMQILRGGYQRALPAAGRCWL